MNEKQLDLMWSFMQIGGWDLKQTNIDVLKESCQYLQSAMTQKTTGQRKNKPNDVDWNDLETHINIIVIETMILYLSGALNKLQYEIGEIQ